MESDPIKDFNKIKEKVEKVFQEFESTSDLNLKNKSFNQYSKYIDKLVDIKNPTEEIDDYIFECIARAKGMRKK